MENQLRQAVERGASVIHVKAGDVFRARVEGEVIKLSSEPFTPEDTRRIAERVIASERDRARIDEIKDYDCSWELEGVARFRINILKQRGSFMIVMRVIPREVPTLEELYLPKVLADIADLSHGLVLVTGGVGTGKSTTQAAMIGWVNNHRKKHIITLEDPIEYLHRDDVSTITQRDVGVDTESFHTGLRAALRQDPDIILIGEMRDKETVEIAIRASELGQLVISTMHTPTVTATLSHLIAVFPEDERDLARIRLAETMQAVISQKLLPRAGQDARIPVVEILRATPAIRDCILLAKPAEEVMELVEAGRQAYGMQSFHQHLKALVDTGMLDYDVAKAAAPSPSDFELVMQTLAGDDIGEPSSGFGLNPSDKYEF
ncbi:MAG: type IV pilus twitching motility protein PilT [Gemmatimonadota bacterium]